jgi:hypothetical protein
VIVPDRALTAIYDPNKHLIKIRTYGEDVISRQIFHEPIPSKIIDGKRSYRFVPLSALNRHCFNLRDSLEKSKRAVDKVSLTEK